MAERQPSKLNVAGSIPVSRSILTVRIERSADRAAIRAVHDTAFGGPAEGRIVDDLRGTRHWIPSGSLVAEEDGNIVGHVLLSCAEVQGAGDRIGAVGLIGPVGVLPERQGRGVGAALMRAAIATAETEGLPAVCLLGHAGYYPRFGFGPARAIGLEPPKPWPETNWMALRLSSWHEELRGRVQLPPVFPEE